MLRTVGALNMCLGMANMAIAAMLPEDVSVFDDIQESVREDI